MEQLVVRERIAPKSDGKRALKDWWEQKIEEAKYKGDEEVGKLRTKRKQTLSRSAAAVYRSSRNFGKRLEFHQLKVFQHQEAQQKWIVQKPTLENQALIMETGEKTSSSPRVRFRAHAEICPPPPPRSLKQPSLLEETVPPPTPPRKSLAKQRESIEQRSQKSEENLLQNLEASCTNEKIDLSLSGLTDLTDLNFGTIESKKTEESVPSIDESSGPQDEEVQFDEERLLLFTLTSTVIDLRDYGDKVYIVGSVPELGEWDVDKAERMFEEEEGLKWVLDIRMPVSTRKIRVIEYLYAVKDDDGRIRKELTPNRKMEIGGQSSGGEEPPPVTLFDEWETTAEVSKEQQIKNEEEEEKKRAVERKVIQDRVITLRNSFSMPKFRTSSLRKSMRKSTKIVIGRASALGIRSIEPSPNESPPSNHPNTPPTPSTPTNSPSTPPSAAVGLGSHRSGKMKGQIAFLRRESKHAAVNTSSSSWVVPKIQRRKSKILLCKRRRHRTIAAANPVSHFFRIPKRQDDRKIPSVPPPEWNQMPLCLLFSFGDTCPNSDFLREHLMREGRLENRAAIELIKRAKTLLRSEPNLLQLTAPVLVFGDLHGQYYDLLRLLDEAKNQQGAPPSKTYLFLGDYVDRGNFSTEVCLYLFSLKLRWPNHVYLLRGNHESRQLTDHFNFKSECLHKYNIAVYEAFMDAFDTLPLAAVLTSSQGSFLAVHGGLSPSIKTLEDIEHIERIREPPEKGAMCDLLWSDPVDEEAAASMRAEDLTEWYDIEYVHNSTRGCGYVFGFQATFNFLKDNKLMGIIRGHEVQKNGYFLHTFGLKDIEPALVITVFSAPNYCDMYGNNAAFLVFGSTSITFNTITAVDHPYYLPNFLNGITYSLPYVIENLTSILLTMIALGVEGKEGTTEEFDEYDNKLVEHIRSNLLHLRQIREKHESSVMLQKEVAQLASDTEQFEQALRLDFRNEKRPREVRRLVKTWAG